MIEKYIIQGESMTGWRFPDGYREKALIGICTIAATPFQSHEAVVTNWLEDDEFIRFLKGNPELLHQCMIPIAVTGFGDYILLTENGEICRICHETDEIQPICRSFAEFLDSGSTMKWPERYTGDFAKWVSLLKEGRSSEILQLLASGGIDLSLCDNYGRTLMEHAVWEKDSRVVEALLKLKAPKGIALHCAVSDRQIECVELLLADGASLEERSGMGDTPVDSFNREVARMSRSEYNHFARYLITKGAKLEEFRWDVTAAGEP
jgi:hypothetical protein